MPGGILSWERARRKVIHCLYCGLRKEVNRRNRGYCSTKCANELRSGTIWNGNDLHTVQVLEGLTLEKNPETGDYQWRCHCGATAARTPGTTPPCRHADMGRLMLNVEAL